MGYASTMLPAQTADVDPPLSNGVMAPGRQNSIGACLPTKQSLPTYYPMFHRPSADPEVKQVYRGSSDFFMFTIT